MKKIISAFLFLSILISLFAASFALDISAETQYTATLNSDYLYREQVEHVLQYIYDFSRYYEDTETVDDTDDFWIEIDIAKFNMTPDEAFECYFTMFPQYPELFFLDGYMTASYYPSTGKSASIFFRTEYHIDDIPEMIERFEAAALPVLEEASTLNTDLDKILFIHNYIVMNTKYNEDVIKYDDGPYRVYTAYGTIVEHDAVCQGYAYAFNYFVRRLGILSEYAVSDTLEHGWNIVKVGNYWYHLDATWNDPIYDYVGKIKYENFLRSESGIEETGHHDMNDYRVQNGTYTNYDLSDTRFDDWFLHDSYTFRGNAAYHDGRWYFMMNADDGYTYICSTGNIFVPKSQLNYDIVTRCASTSDVPGLYIYEDRLYYTKRNGIYTCNFDGTNETAVYQPTLNSNQKVYGITARDGSVFFNIETSYNTASSSHPKIYSCKITPPTPNENATFLQNGSIIWDIQCGTTAGEILGMFDGDCYITDVTGKEVTLDTILGTGFMVKTNGTQTANLSLTIAVSGDANGDALISGKDLIRIKKYLKNMETDTIYSLCGDMNRDGKITDSDLAQLTSIINN